MRASIKTHNKKRSGSFFGSFFRRKGSEGRDRSANEREAQDQDTPNIQYYQDYRDEHPMSPPRPQHARKLDIDYKKPSSCKRSAQRRPG